MATPAPSSQAAVLIHVVELLSLCDLLPDPGIVRQMCEGWHEIREEALAEVAAARLERRETAQTVEE